ncbi:uncharacterized protein EDB93DRAFT_1250147 [Suillus bovinus]|uniref:uncharacterized protein n=1 Tax=Suillus bovinus TaxID=48563 RepID=UPI001B885440|nr:uncharacterized protein EDB93DRAFT_1250147 [Suillus bovinus]KAG2148712.1 hypothetical protein EDB93DRAFT_1250147 [Suillus bovinus]
MSSAGLSRIHHDRMEAERLREQQAHDQCLLLAAVMMVAALGSEPAILILMSNSICPMHFRLPLLQEHLDAWAPTIFLLILLVSALASYLYPDLTLVILVILAFPFALYLSLQQSQYIWPDAFADKAYPCSVPPPD